MAYVGLYMQWIISSRSVVSKDFLFSSYSNFPENLRLLLLDLKLTQCAQQSQFVLDHVFFANLSTLVGLLRSSTPPATAADTP